MKDSSRRKFLQQTAALTAAAWSAPGAATSAVRPAFIVDTHTHFYDPRRAQGVPWPPKTDALLYRPVLPEHYRSLPQPQRVNATVVVEASVWVEDNQWILDLARDDPFIVGLVGNLPVGTPEFRGHLKRFAAHPLFRGLRIGSAKLAECLGDATALADLKLLAEGGCSLDLLARPADLPNVVKLAAQLPGLRLIIDHVANVKTNGPAPPAEWRDGMKAAASHANVFCKVSGLVEGTGRNDGTAPKLAAHYQPVLDHIWNEFGTSRLVYGSNWPVSERFAACATVQQIALDYFAAKGQSVVDKVFHENSQAFYRWVKR